MLIYTDGACLGNPGPGGWAAILYSSLSKTIVEIAGFEDHTTNNRMELKAAIEALRQVDDKITKLTIYIDSSYVVNGITQWVRSWQAHNWQTASGLAVANKELWQDLVAVVRTREKTTRLQWQQILGHSGIPGNERADQLAQAFAAKKNIPLFQGPYAGYGFDILSTPDLKTKRPPGTSKSSSKKAYIYLSVVNGVLARHSTWDECNARVKGVRGAKFKKAVSPTDEAQIIREWGCS